MNDKESNCSICNKPFLECVCYNESTKPFACPVCGGNGLVPQGYYNQTSGRWTTGSLEPEMCRSCNGTGVIWKP